MPLSVVSVQLEHVQAANEPLVMRRWPVSTGGCTSFLPHTGVEVC
jgi:hypothetical protein